MTLTSVNHHAYNLYHYLCLSSRGCQTPFVSTANRSLPSLLATLGPQEFLLELSTPHLFPPHSLVGPEAWLRTRSLKDKACRQNQNPDCGPPQPHSPCILFCFSWPLACLQPLQESPGRPPENQVLYQSPCGPVDPHRAREMFCYLIPLHLQSIFTAGIHILPPPPHTSQTPFITLTSHRLPHVPPLHKDLIHNTSKKVARAGYDGSCFKSSTHRR